MKLTTIFRRAAEIMQAVPDSSGFGACMALFNACDLPPRRQVAEDLLMEAFGYDAREAGPRYVYWGLNFSDDPAEVKRCRVLMLLFLAEIAKDLE